SGRSVRTRLSCQLLRGRRVRALGRQAPADRGRMGDCRSRCFGQWQSDGHRSPASLPGHQRWVRPASNDRGCVGMDRQPLYRLPALPPGRRRGRRIQRQVHVEPDGIARRGGGDAGRPRPHNLSQFLPALGPLGLLRAASRRGCVMGDIGPSFTFHDLAPSEESFRDAVIAGLSREPKSLPCKLFYDARGSALFEKICDLPEYYLTRTEIAILDRFAADIAARIGPHCRLIELGSGASHKVRILLEALDRPAAYVAVDISREQLRRAAARLAADFPKLAVVAVCADYTRPFTLPELPGPDGKRVGFFPGSTIGNFEPRQVVTFLSDWAKLLGTGGEMLIGADLKKDAAILNRAYNDK